MSDEEENKSVELSDAQLEKLASVVTASMLASQKPTEPNKEPDKPKEGGVGFNPADVAKEVMNMLKEQKMTDSNKVYETLWKEKYNSAVSSIPGLSDFIDGEDDYGRVRKEQLNSIENYEDKLSALSKLGESFKEASAGQVGRRPIVNAKMQKKIEDAESKYDSVKDKLDKGEYNNVSELTKDWMDALGQEMATLA